MRRLLHRLRFGHWPAPWVIDWDRGVYDHGGCRTCVRQRVMRAIAREPRRVPPVGFP